MIVRSIAWDIPETQKKTFWKIPLEKNWKCSSGAEPLITPKVTQDLVETADKTPSFFVPSLKIKLGKWRQKQGEAFAKIKIISKTSCEKFADPRLYGTPPPFCHKELPG